jgi:galactokinase
MDQLASACGVEGAALLLDCRSVTFEAVPLPAGVAVVLVDSAVPHSLVDSEYGERRKSCEAAAAALDVEFLRDVDEPTLLKAEQQLDPVVFRRARHVVTENDRVLRAAARCTTATSCTSARCSRPATRACRPTSRSPHRRWTGS